MGITNYQAPSPHVDVSSGTSRQFAPGVMLIELSGEIGQRKPISLRTVRGAIERHKPHQHIHIRLTTRGGDCEESFNVYDYLRSLPVPLSMEADSRCLSGGMIVFMAGAFRSATARTELLIHPANLGRKSLPRRVTARALKSRRDQLASIDSRIAQLFAARTGYDFGWFKDEATNELPLDPVDAVATGLVHQFQGITSNIDPTWPIRARSLADSGVYLPQYLTSSNYFRACECARTLYGFGSAA